MLDRHRGARVDSTATTGDGSVRAVEDHQRYSVSATIASGSIEMQRILLARSLLAARCTST